jgi:hypothetical protein
VQIPAEPSPELRIPNAAAQPRMVSVAKIRLDRRKSTRSFKGIICDDISEFESHMPSHAVVLSQVRSPAIVMHPLVYRPNTMPAWPSAALQLDPRPISLNLHGNSSEPVDITLSDGTRVAGADTDLVQQLRSALLARSVNVGSCNWPPDGLTAENLCGTTNAQGRLSNGSPEACRMNAASASGLFLHIEQHRNMRDDPSLLIQALQDVLPIQPRFSR